ncbi:MAG: hypothetical protein J6Y90_01490, partial [Lachnospiraceae bacterium]|nr:hypothetical protein [Lachnospiraceae bacterium]
MEKNTPDENIKAVVDESEGKSGAVGPTSSTVDDTSESMATPSDSASVDTGAAGEAYGNQPTGQVPYTQPGGGYPYGQPTGSTSYNQGTGSVPYTQSAVGSPYAQPDASSPYAQPDSGSFGGYAGMTPPVDDYDDDDEETPKKGHLGIVIYLLILICGAAAAIYYVRSTGFELPGVDRFFSFETQIATEQNVNGTEPEPAASKQVWNMDVDSDINQLVRNYYIALQSSDIEKLNELTDESVTVDQANVESAAKYIEGYQNIRCYVAPGSTKDENGLYVAYDIKFKNISTTAPGLVPAYVRRTQDGTPKLIPYENFDEAITAFMTSTSAQPEISSLRSSVTAKYDDALAADPVLAKFVDDLGRGVVNIPDTQTVDVPSGESTAESIPTNPDDIANAAASAVAAAVQNGSNGQDSVAEPSGESVPSMDGTVVTSGDGLQVVEGVSFTPATMEMWTFDFLRARSTPKTDVSDNIVTTLEPRTKVFVVGVSDVWDMIMFENG